MGSEAKFSWKYLSIWQFTPQPQRAPLVNQKENGKDYILPYSSQRCIPQLPGCRENIRPLEAALVHTAPVHIKYDNPPLPVSNEMKSVHKRKETFQKLRTRYPWMDNGYKTAAECGWFYTGSHDILECHRCRLRLRDWGNDNDFLVEHCRNSSECRYLLTEFLDIVNNIIAELKNNTEPSMKAANRTAKDGNETAALSLKYMTKKERVDSFIRFPGLVREGSPTTPRLSVDVLATNGFYYYGFDNKMRCYSCNKDIDVFYDGDPSLKHFPLCSHLLERQAVAE